jgi:hypothetical protein
MKQVFKEKNELINQLVGELKYLKGDDPKLFKKGGVAANGGRI